MFNYFFYFFAPSPTEPDSDPNSDFFSARWQLLNLTPFSFSKPQVAVAETDTDSEIDLFSNWQLLKPTPCFFCSLNSVTVAVVVALNGFSLEIFRHSTAISPKRKLVGLLFE